MLLSRVAPTQSADGGDVSVSVLAALLKREPQREGENVGVVLDDLPLSEEAVTYCRRQIERLASGEMVCDLDRANQNGAFPA